MSNDRIESMQVDVDELRALRKKVTELEASVEAERKAGEARAAAAIEAECIAEAKRAAEAAQKPSQQPKQSAPCSSKQATTCAPTSARRAYWIGEVQGRAHDEGSILNKITQDVAIFLFSFFASLFVFWLGGIDFARGEQQAICLTISFVAACLVALVSLIFRGRDGI